MRVFNLTDMKTDVLEQRGLVGQHIAVAGRMINPGEYADVESTVSARANIEELVRIGALAIDQPPPPYVLARQQAAAAGGTPSVRQHLDVQETKVAGELLPAQPAAEGETVVVEKRDPTVGETEELPPPAAPEDPPPMQPPAQQKPGGKKPGNR